MIIIKDLKKKAESASQGKWIRGYSNPLDSLKLFVGLDLPIMLVDCATSQYHEHGYLQRARNVTYLEAAQPENILQLIALVESQQAKIDALMWEYCPEDMTKEQVEEWKRNQQPADPQPVIDLHQRPDDE